MISANIFFFECLLGARHCSKCTTIIFNVPATLCGKYSHYPHFTNAKFGEENLSDLPKKLSDKNVLNSNGLTPERAFLITVLKDDEGKMTSGARSLFFLHFGL